LLAAAEVVANGELDRLRETRYEGWSGELGQRIISGELNLAALADLATDKGLNPVPRSGRQELCESVIARCCTY
jgi:xylose isomerase